MKYWITQHYPPYADGREIQLGIWLEPHTISVANGMQPGDKVFIHQAGKGETIIETYSDRPPKEIRRLKGKSGVVMLAEVTSPPSEKEGCGPETYKGGRTRDWKYRADVREINSAGFVRREDVARAIGYKENYSFHGFGTKNSGLRELSESQFLDLKQQFVSSRIAIDNAVKERVSSARRFGPGGEGPEHLALKMAIAANPSKVLGEEGLTTWKVEYLLDTSDKIDLVLQDGDGRFVVVEVEVDCDANEMIGPLQCMKYRAMMSYLHDRKIKEVRAILAAHTVHGGVCRRCDQNDIRVIQIDRKLIHAM